MSVSASPDPVAPVNPLSPVDPAAHTSSHRLKTGARILAALLLAVVVMVGSIVVIGRYSGATATADRTDGRAVGAAAGAIGLPRVTTPTTALAVTPVTRPLLPIPDPLPDDPYAPTPQVVVGHISIPKLGVSADLQEGMTLTAINRGPGHWPGTALPGELGNMVIAGHRTTYSKPFNRIDELVAGDTVVFTTGRGTFTYDVRGVIIVPAANVGIAAQSDAHTATLFACHPKGSAANRVVAKLRLLDAAGQPVDPDSALPPVEQGSDPVTDTTLLVRSGADGATDPLSAADG